jgi:hypothetical protein
MREDFSVEIRAVKKGRINYFFKGFTQHNGIVETRHALSPRTEMAPLPALVKTTGKYITARENLVK